MTDRTCTIEDCASPVRRRGWCASHYARWLEHGDPLLGRAFIPRPRARTVDQRFWEKVAKRGPDECWNWTASLLTDGYGNFRYQGKAWPAHRWLWAQTHGPIPQGLVVRHTCDNPPCVNPAHHLLGTNADNKQDEVDRGRHAYGSRNGWSKLHENDVKQIKRRLRDGDRRDTIATDFQVCIATVSHIASGRSWRHVLI